MRSRLVLLSVSVFLCFALVQGCKPTAVAPVDGSLTELADKLTGAKQNLDKVWTALQSVAGGDTLKRLTADQSSWLEQGRDAAVSALMSKEAANPGSVPFSAYGDKLDKAAATAMVTQERAKALNIMLAQAKDPNFKPTLAGKVGVENRMGTNWYTFTPDQWGTAMTLGKVRSTLPMSSAAKTLLQKAAKTGDTVKLTGLLHLPDSYDGMAKMAVQGLGEGMAWRELDQWDNFDLAK